MKRILTVLLLLFLQQTIFSQGSYIEFKISSAFATGVFGNMKTYYQDGNSRIEMVMKPSAGTEVSERSFVGIVLAKTPNTLYLMDEKKKTYSELTTNNNEDYKDYEQSEYEVTVIGKEKVNGYNCTHIKVKIKGAKSEQEMWTSKEVNDYASFMKLKTKYTGKPNLIKAMQEKGVSGFAVRIVAQEQGNRTQLDLVKAEKRNIPAALFSLNGYTKTEGFSGMPGGEQLQQMMKKVQNMTPEERDAMIKRMKELYGTPPH